MLASIEPRRRMVVLSLALALLVATPLASPAPGQTETPIDDPIPEDPIVSGLGLTLEEFVTMPPSEPSMPPTDPRLMRWARINYLGEVPDGSGRLFVPDLNGKMYLIEDGTPHEYLDVGAAFADHFHSHQGLGSGFGFVTFHPEFAENGRFYTVHTEARGALETETPDLPSQENPSHHGVLTEWTADDPSANSFTGTQREVIRMGFRTFIHGIQEVGFNPNAEPGNDDYGLLYMGIGDGGIGRSTDHPQDLAMPHGKILRIDPDGTNGSSGEYGIPPTNPFVGDPGALGEIYAYGLRNPHRFSWDLGAQHRMFVGNIGEQNIESIYEVRRGANFGWSEREGPFVYRDEDRCNLYPLPENDREFGYVYPVAAYDHDAPEGWPCGSDTGDAVIGGFVYRGSDVPQLRGKYIFGDDVNGRLFYTNVGEMRAGKPELATLYEFMLFDDAGRQIPRLSPCPRRNRCSALQVLAGDARVDLRFGSDANGEVYVLSKANGKIWKIADARRFAGCDAGATTVTDVMGAEDWDPVTPEKWEFPGTEVVLSEPGAERPGPRRPFEYAVLTTGPRFGSVQIDAEVRIDTPVEITNRDVIIVFGYQSDTEFYYAHLSTDNTIYPHNGIFVVNDADRVRIEDQWDGSLGAPPAITDQEWHDVRVVHCAETGEIAVYLDGSENPLMTATDTTFDSGKIGFGSFDNIGRISNLSVTGTSLDVLPSLEPNLAANYDFEHPVFDDSSQERDEGFSGTNIDLVNGGAEMRVADGAYPASTYSMQTMQVNPTIAGNDDWKAGIYSEPGVPTLNSFNQVRETTIMGWFKMTGDNPSPNTNTSNPDDFYNAVGLAGVLTGDSEGHLVRALLEVINVDGELRLVALGRRLDGGRSQTFAANQDWRTLLPPNEWVFLTATFDFDNGTMGLYKNGQPLGGFYTISDDAWEVIGEPEPDFTSATDPRGIKIGGSFPQNNREQNPCNCRFDGLMFLDRVVTRGEVMAQYQLATQGP